VTADGANHTRTGDHHVGTHPFISSFHLRCDIASLVRLHNRIVNIRHTENTVVLLANRVQFYSLDYSHKKSSAIAEWPRDASCYISRGMGVRNISNSTQLLQSDRATLHAIFHEAWEWETFQTAKVAFKVIQGHWQWCHSIGHIRFPIRLPLQLCLYLALLTRYYHLFPRMYRGHVTLNTSFLDVIYHACRSTPVCQSTCKIWSA